MHPKLQTHYFRNRLQESSSSKILNEEGTSRHIGIPIMRNLKGSRKGVRERAFQSIVKPIIEYATSVLDPHKTSLIK